MRTRYLLLYFGVLFLFVLFALGYLLVSYDSGSQGVADTEGSQRTLDEPVVPDDLPGPDTVPSPVDEAPVVAARPEEAPEDLPPPRYRLYLILDDAGQNLTELAPFELLRGPFTLAVLPHLPFSVEAAQWALERGHEVILHQPMEAFSGADPGPGAISHDDDPDVIRRTLQANLLSIPGITGVNNHMGSRVTATPEAMRSVLSVIREEELYFLDSRTTPESVVPQVAAELGMAVLVRQVFLDDDRTPAAIQAELDRALEIARAEGSVIMIGHVMVPFLAEELIRRQDRLRQEGFVFAPLKAAYREIAP
jgi:polysaccharide deacetylase 2 family uncharacterized protein YibQ